MRAVTILSLAVLIFSGCSTMGSQDGEKRTRELRDALAPGRADTGGIRIVAFCTEPMNDGASRRLERHGIFGSPITESIFTATASRDQIERLLAMDFIATLDVDQEKKFDAILRRKLDALIRDRSDQPISLFGKCSSEITAAMRARLDSTGADIESVIKDIFTATCNRRAVYLLGSLEFVSSLQLSTVSN